MFLLCFSKKNAICFICVCIWIWQWIHYRILKPYFFEYESNYIQGYFQFEIHSGLLSLHVTIMPLLFFFCFFLFFYTNTQKVAKLETQNTWWNCFWYLKRFWFQFLFPAFILAETKPVSVANHNNHTDHFSLLHWNGLCSDLFVVFLH